MMSKLHGRVCDWDIVPERTIVSIDVAVVNGDAPCLSLFLYFCTPRQSEEASWSLRFGLVNGVRLTNANRPSLHQEQETLFFELLDCRDAPVSRCHMRIAEVFTSLFQLHASKHVLPHCHMMANCPLVHAGQ